MTLLSLGPWNVSLLAHAFSLGMPRTSTRGTSLQSSELTFQVNFSGASKGKSKGEKVEGFEYEVWDDNQGGWCDEAPLPPGVRPLCSGEL